MLFESVILPALFWTPPPSFFSLSLCFWFFLYRLTQYLRVAALQRTPLFIQEHADIIGLSLSLSLVCVLLGVGVHMWCIYDISPLPLSICFTIYGMIRMLSNDWGIATWQPRESLLRGWLARNVGWMILSWSNIRNRAIWAVSVFRFC